MGKSNECNLNNNVACYNVVTHIAKLYNHTMPHKGSQVSDSLASTFEGLGYRGIAMVNSYNWYKVESLKVKR